MRHANQEERGWPPFDQKKQRLDEDRQPTAGAVAPPWNPVLMSSNPTINLQLSASPLLFIHHIGGVKRRKAAARPPASGTHVHLLLLYLSSHNHGGTNRSRKKSIWRTI